MVPNAQASPERNASGSYSRLFKFWVVAVLDVYTVHSSAYRHTGASFSMRSSRGDKLSPDVLVGISSSITSTVSTVGVLNGAGMDGVGDAFRRLTSGFVIPYKFEELNTSKKCELK